MCALLRPLPTWGEEKLLDLVHSFSKSQTTPEVIQQDLGLAPEEFDKQYLAWIGQKYGAEAAHFDEWREKLKGLAAAAQRKQYDTVFEQGPAVLAMYPEYVDDQNVIPRVVGKHCCIKEHYDSRRALSRMPVPSQFS